MHVLAFGNITVSVDDGGGVANIVVCGIVRSRRLGNNFGEGGHVTFEMFEEVGWWYCTIGAELREILGVKLRGLSHAYLGLSDLGEK